MKAGGKATGNTRGKAGTASGTAQTATKSEAVAMAEQLLAAADALLKEVSPGSHGSRSGMISLDLAPGTIPPLDGGLTDHHITVAFLGSDLSDDDFECACERAAAVAASIDGPLAGVVGGIGYFEPSDASDGLKPVYTVPDIPRIEQVHGPLADLSASEHKEYHPHVTLGYVDPADALPAPVPVTPVCFTHLSVHRGDQVRHFPFGGPAAKTGGQAVAAGPAGSTPTDGIEVSTGLHGVDAGIDGEDEVSGLLRKWRTNSRTRVKKGLAPRLFLDVPNDVSGWIWTAPREGHDPRGGGRGLRLGGGKSTARPGPGGEREADLVAWFRPRILAALTGSLNADELARLWLASVPAPAGGIGVVSQADRTRAEAIAGRARLDPAVLAAALLALYTASWGAGALSGVQGVRRNEQFNRSPLAVRLDLYDTSRWQPADTSLGDRIVAHGLEVLRKSARRVERGDRLHHGLSAGHRPQGLDRRRPSRPGRCPAGGPAGPLPGHNDRHHRGEPGYEPGALDVYRTAGVTEWNWMTVAGACAVCLAQEAANPHLMGEPEPPAHPNCRCHPIPVT